MTSVETEIQETVGFFTSRFSERDCFKVWVDNINCGEKFVVWCRFRCYDGNRRVTAKYHRTIQGCA